MDGHEHADVVAYCKNVFLPQMLKYESRMTQYDAAGEPTLPKLKPGEKWIITEWHDKSCLHTNNETNSAWLQKDEQPLQKKGRGQLIHISDWINEDDGQLVNHNSNGKVVRDAQKIIYPGSNGDAWWNCAQLIEQTKIAIDIFNKSHPDCQALFIFNNSSAHASLPPDALKAFEINKLEGGKRRHQRDTVILMNNPDIAKCRKPQ
jgi:hypothetical protein